MKKLLNTLYVTTEDAYLALDGENVVVTLPDESKHPFPLHTLENIVCFSYKGASPALMGKCAADGITLSFFTPRGRYLASIDHPAEGNVYLRRTQFRTADDSAASCAIARNFLTGKLYNSEYVLRRCIRDHALQVNVEELQKAAGNIRAYELTLAGAENTDSLRGIEGNAAAEYFGVFTEMILQNREAFAFSGRNRRPPLDRTNALLSFAYSLLTADCASALYSVGLDPYVGFMHTDRPGRKSLALDLMEELRSVYADRFVLTLINNRVIAPGDFLQRENKTVILTDAGRRKFLQEWQKRKKETITHPFLSEKMEWGLVPYSQAMLLARVLRGDLEAYPPFFWK